MPSRQTSPSCGSRAIRHVQAHQLQTTPQVVVLNKNTYGTTHVVGASNTTVLANSVRTIASGQGGGIDCLQTYQNFLFKLVSQALVLPTNVSTTISSISDASAIYGILSGIPQLVQTVDTAQAITVFVPNNQAARCVLDKAPLC